MSSVRMAEWSKAPDSSSGPQKRAWAQIPLLVVPPQDIYEKKIKFIFWITCNTVLSRKLNLF